MTKDAKTHYEVLGVPPYATDTEIEAQYQKLIKELDSKPSVTQEYRIRVDLAHNVLSNKCRRALYDEGLMAGLPAEPITEEIETPLYQYIEGKQTKPDVEPYNDSSERHKICQKLRDSEEKMHKEAALSRKDLHDEYEYGRAKECDRALRQKSEISKKHKYPGRVEWGKEIDNVSEVWAHDNEEASRWIMDDIKTIAKGHNDEVKKFEAEWLDAVLEIEPEQRAKKNKEFVQKAKDKEQLFKDDWDNLRSEHINKLLDAHHKYLYELSDIWLSHENLISRQGTRSQARRP